MVWLRELKDIGTNVRARRACRRVVEVEAVMPERINESKTDE
jgi:hypothetical protein